MERVLKEKKNGLVATQKHDHWMKEYVFIYKALILV